MKKIVSLMALIMVAIIVLVGCKAAGVDAYDSGSSSEIKVVVDAEAADERESLVDLNDDAEEEQILSELGYDYGKQFQLPEAGEEIAVLHTNYGDIKMRLFPDGAPLAVENFKTHIKNGYYDGLTFHRVIEDFMIQGGDPLGYGAGGESIWGGTFEDELTPQYLHYKGALCMANRGPDTNGSQFFIVHAGTDEIDQDVLNYYSGKGFEDGVIENLEMFGGAPFLFMQYTVFGQVFEGLSVVDAIAAVETDSGDMPVDPVIIESAEIVVME